MPVKTGSGLAVVMFLALVSCTTGPVRDESRPVSDQAAVVEWVESARELRAQKRFDQAAAKLERALRVEPGNARLWHELAGVYLEQGNFDQAIQFARKSSALAREDSLKSSNRRLVEVAESRRAAGGAPGKQQGY